MLDPAIAPSKKKPLELPKGVDTPVNQSHTPGPPSQVAGELIGVQLVQELPIIGTTP